MNIEILSTAEDDLVDGHAFYERQESGIGNYFLDTLIAEIDSLQLYAGIHRKKWGKYRMLSKRFPFGIFYTIEKQTVYVCAVLDLRRRPSFLRRQVRRENWTIETKETRPTGMLNRFLQNESLVTIGDKLGSLWFVYVRSAHYLKQLIMRSLDES